MNDFRAAGPVLDVHRGLSYALFLPKRPPSTAVVVTHGAASRKENHFDFAYAAQNDGKVALCIDLRGHGSSEGRFCPQVIDDLLEMVSLAFSYAPNVALRGSSLGAFCALLAASRNPSIACCVALCPPSQALLLKGLRTGHLPEFGLAKQACERWFESVDLTKAVRSFGQGQGVMLCHATGDDQVPAEISKGLYSAARAPKRLLLCGGGSHRTLQHDHTVAQRTLGFIDEAVKHRGP
jgi:pimeloyl-ACP methyl ester carboxylesterase